MKGKEITLEEYCARVPKDHTINVEYLKLKAFKDNHMDLWKKDYPEAKEAETNNDPLEQLKNSINLTDDKENN